MYGSEYVALKLAMEKLIGLRYKLRMMGVALDGPANVFCDNDSVVKSAINPEATLKKKNVSIAYHKCCECFAAGVPDIYFVYSDENLADLLTKVLPVVKRKEKYSLASLHEETNFIYTLSKQPFILLLHFLTSLVF